MKAVRLALITATPFLVALTGCGVRGNGVYSERSVVVPATEALAVADGLRVRVTVDESVADGDTRLLISGDENLLEYVRARVSDAGVLELDTTEWVSPDIELEVRFETRTLASAELSGGSQGELRGIRGSRFELDASGGSECVLEGAAEELVATLSGGSELSGRYLSAQAVRLDASGGSSAAVCATTSIRVDASGGSEVDLYCGADSVETDLSGGSELERH